MRHHFAATHVRTKGGVKVIEIDTKRARYFEMPWQRLSGYGRRKFENLMVLQNPTEPIHLIYL